MGVPGPTRVTRSLFSLLNMTRMRLSCDRLFENVIGGKRLQFGRRVAQDVGHDVPGMFAE